MERSNEAWLEDLRSVGAAREAALRDLRALLLGGLRRALGGWRRSVGREFSALAEDFVQEALLRIPERLDTFRGLSRFTTWAHRIAIRIALTELRRRKWQDVSLEDAVESVDRRSMSASGSEPGERLERAELLDRARAAMMTALTERQRTALMAVAMAGMPLDEVARRMGTNRNALYKLIHDARRKLKTALAPAPGDPIPGNERRGSRVRDRGTA